MGWMTQQDGHIVHDVLPIKGHEYEQLGSSSKQLLTWHTEDAFHPYRCDYLGMMCLRNQEQVATTVGSLSSMSLEGLPVDVLFEPRYTIRPDESHLKKNMSDLLWATRTDADELEASYERIEQMNNAPEKIAVLFGHPRDPYIRIDPYFMDALENDEEGQSALDELVRRMDNHLTDLILQPGDCVFIDNYRVVHGRKPFAAKYDGKDRWLKRISLARDLRKSRSARHPSTSRIIF
jgi:Fe(II)/alpha-ketoglutarate-dependent arginine beta-hydroxylase